MATWRFYESVVSFPFFRQVAQPNAQGMTHHCFWVRMCARGLHSSQRMVVLSLGLMLDSLELKISQCPDHPQAD